MISGITRPPLDIDAISEQEKPSFLGVDFDSRPSALRHLLMVQEIIGSFPSDRNTVGLDIGSKYSILGSLLTGFGIGAVRLDIQTRIGSDDFVLGDGKEMPFKSASLDFAVLSHVMAHVDDLEPLLAEVARIIKPGGRLFVLQSNRYGWWKFWGYYLWRSDRRSHHRTFDMWGIHNTLARHHFQVVRMYSPYYFYIHSKWSRLCYLFDRRFASRIPNLFATHWVINACRISGQDNEATYRVPPGMGLKAIIGAMAFVHSLAMKTVELALRLWHRPPDFGFHRPGSRRGEK